ERAPERDRVPALRREDDRFGGREERGDHAHGRDLPRGDPASLPVGPRDGGAWFGHRDHDRYDRRAVQVNRARATVRDADRTANDSALAGAQSQMRIAVMSPFLLITAFVAALADTGACRPVSGVDAHALLERAASRTGLDSAKHNILEVRGYDVRQHAFESDRMYPPYIAEVATLDEWLDPASGVQRTASQTTIGGYEFGLSTMGDARGSYVVRDTGLVPSEAVHGALYETRPLDVWAVLTDWLAASDVRATKQCTYRDYPRLVLERRGARGPEQLYLDPKSGYPVKLDRMEPHYLWGQVHVEYVWSTWEREGAVHVPGAAFRMEDGETEIARVFGVRRMVPRDSAPSLTVPARDAAMTPGIPAFLAPNRPDTARVSDKIFVLRNGGYGEVVALDRDTVFV